MKKVILVAFTLLFCMTVLVTGCASNNVTVKADDSVIVDWADRNVGSPAIPGWLEKLVRGNSENFKSDFEIEKSYIIKYSVGNGKTAESAKVTSKLNYNATRAEELRTAVLSEASKTLNAEPLAKAAMAAAVDLTGHELVTQFWQEIETSDSESESKTKDFICYSVYKISKENWQETLKCYFKEVISRISDSDTQNQLAALITNVYENTTSEKEKTESEVRDEINAKINAIETGTKNSAAPAPKESDSEWLKILDMAFDHIF